MSDDPTKVCGSAAQLVPLGAMVNGPDAIPVTCILRDGHERPRKGPPLIDGVIIDHGAPRSEWVMYPGTAHVARVEWSS